MKYILLTCVTILLALLGAGVAGADDYLGPPLGCDAPYCTYAPVVNFSATTSTIEVAGIALERDTSPFNGVVRLAQVYCNDMECAFALDLSFSPGAWINDDGAFTIEDVPIVYHGYAVLFSELGDERGPWYVVCEDDGRTPKLYMTYPGKNLDIGTIFVYVVGQTKMSWPGR